MLKVVHLLAGIIALVLSFIPSLSGAMPLLLHPDAIALLLIGLLNLQFIPSAKLHSHNQSRPVTMTASALLVLAAAIQATILLAPIGDIAGQPATLASLLLAVVGVLLHVAAAQSRSERRPHSHSRPHRSAASSKGAPTQTTRSAAPAAGRETGTVKWFNTSKGFGFISRDSGDDVFVHFRAIRGEGHRVLVEGQRVEFTVAMRDKGLQAEDVTASHSSH
jgi:CspA family cold shock protein